MYSDCIAELESAAKITACFVDLDNTLWKGVIAEGQKPVLFKDRYRLLKLIHLKGIQLFVVSKNDADDVSKAFKQLGIDEGIFTSVTANWDAKYLNIERILRVTQIRPETAVFIDDNSFELNEVTQRIPLIHVLDALNFGILSSVPAITSKKEQTLTEINERINRYRTAISAQTLNEECAGNDVDFYRRLKRVIQLGLVPSDNLDRVTRLLVETHRLNFNPGKFKEYGKAIDYMHDRFNKGDLVYAVSTSEGGYSLGLTGVLIVTLNGKSAVVTDGTFSCGIIGRDFEEKTLLVLIEGLRAKGIETLDVLVTLTSTNVRLRKIFGALGFLEKGKKADDNCVLHLRYSLKIKDYTPLNNFEWISVSKEKPSFEYVGHVFVIKFFEEHVKPLIKQGARVANLGSARGEVLGLLQEDARQKFYDFLKQKHVTYTKIDLEYYPEEQNVVANAEDLAGVLGDSTQDLVIAVELLEHTRNPWKVISEMTRVCKKGGYLFISVPSFNFAKHEYPIDLWRFGPETIKEIFSRSGFQVSKLDAEGDEKLPRRTIVLVKKTGEQKLSLSPMNGKTDVTRGITVFP